MDVPKRDDIVRFCAQAAAACFAHYADAPLSERDTKKLVSALDKIIPDQFDTLGYLAYKEQYEREQAAEIAAAGESSGA